MSSVYVAPDDRRCLNTCPHGSRCRLEAGHEREPHLGTPFGCSHLPPPVGCVCNEPDAPALDMTVGRMRVRCALAARAAVRAGDMAIAARQLAHAMRAGDLLVTGVDETWEEVVRGDERAAIADAIALPPAEAR